MIENEDLERFHHIVESFSDVENQRFNDAEAFFVTNKDIKEICARLVDEKTTTEEQETEVCYILLVALSFLVIPSSSSLITKTLRRNRAILKRIKPSLRKAQLYTYLYCLDPLDVYRQEAQNIIASWKDKTSEEERFIRSYQMIMGGEN